MTTIMSIQCSSCDSANEDEYYRFEEDIYCVGCLIGDGYCHICGSSSQYCQGHGDETCGCICDEGCFCGDCGFDELEHAIELTGAENIEEHAGHEDICKGCGAVVGDPSYQRLVHVFNVVTQIHVVAGMQWRPETMQANGTVIYSENWKVLSTETL